MKNFLKRYGQYFWVLPFFASSVEWYKVLVENDGDYFMAIMMSGLTYYFWGVGTGRIIDKDIKSFKDNDEEK